MSAADGLASQGADAFAPTLQPLPLLQVFVVADGGADLEHFELRTFEEVRSILLQASRAGRPARVPEMQELCKPGLHWVQTVSQAPHSHSSVWSTASCSALHLPHLQTALAVAVAEEACQFEHRDLHWGNLLIRRSEEPAATAAVGARLRGVDLEAGTSGVTVSSMHG